MTGARPIVEDVVVHAHGRVSPADHVYAHEKVKRACRFAHGPVPFARVDLEIHTNPSRELKASVRAELDVDGHMVRAHADAETIRAAIDLLEDRLRDQLDRLGNRYQEQRRRPRQEDREP